MTIDEDPHASYKLLASEFKKLGYIVKEKHNQDERAEVTYENKDGKSWTTLAAHISYPFDSDYMREVSRNKEAAYEYAAAQGVSIPYTREIKADETLPEQEAQLLLDTYKKLIVKPSNASLSRGLTIEIENAKQLYEAITYAKETHSNVLVQEQVSGGEIRFIVVDNKVVAALLRQTAQVVGDGTSSVSQLIVDENKKREELNFAYISYPQLTDRMIDPNLFTSDRILAEGEVLELNAATMIKNGCSVYEILDAIDPSYMAIVENLIKGLDAGFVAVDIFLQDPTVPATADNYNFIEFNTSPVLKLFYACRDGKMFDIVPLLVTSIDTWLHRE